MKSVLKKWSVLTSLTLCLATQAFANDSDPGDLVEKSWGIGLYVDTSAYNQLLENPNVVQRYDMRYANDLHRLKDAFDGASICNMIPEIEGFLRNHKTIATHAFVEYTKENSIEYRNVLVELKDVPIRGVVVYFGTTNSGCYVGQAPTDREKEKLQPCAEICTVASRIRGFLNTIGRRSSNDSGISKNAKAPKTQSAGSVLPAADLRQESGT